MGIFLTTCCKKMKVSDVGCQASRKEDAGYMYETSQNWHDLLMTTLLASMAEP